jgi:transcriptional regulator with XRE-family HTH domain
MPLIEGRQIRAARALLGWTAEQLAAKVGLTRQAIKRIEDGETQAREGTLGDIAHILDEQGVDFCENSGVRFKPQGVEVLTGAAGLRKHFDEVYEYLRKHGGVVQQIGLTHNIVAPILGDDFQKMHINRMTALVKQKSDVAVQLILCENDSNFLSAGYATYRWQRGGTYDEVAYYLYGDRLAIMSFVGDPSPIIALHKIPSIAASYRKQFEKLWQDAVIPPDYNFKKPRPGHKNKGTQKVWSDYEKKLKKNKP